MAGLHGKNAELRLSTTETQKTNQTFVIHPDPDLAARSVYKSPDQNWKFIPRGKTGAANVTYDSPVGTERVLDANSRFINYADGSIRIPPEHIALLDAASIRADYITMEMETVANLTAEDRSYELNVEADILDTTTLNENFKTFVEGIQGWTGSLDGLYLNPDRYKLAIASASGTIPQKILRLRPDPEHPETYFQGVVIFPTWNITGGFDAVIERTVDFNGNGPLELMEDGIPFFQAD